MSGDGRGKKEKAATQMRERERAREINAAVWWKEGGAE